MHVMWHTVQLSLHELERINAQMQSISFDTLYGFYDYQNIHGNAKELVLSSLGRYV